MASNAVPVVLGGKSREDYEKIAPPNSFIHVNDFSTVKDLGLFLEKLSKSKEEYLKFLYWLTPQGKQEWKSKLYKLSEDQPLTGLQNHLKYGHKGSFNTICKKLKETKTIERKIVEHLSIWWFGKGYSLDSDTFSVCNADSGPSGRPLGWLITLIYTVVFVVFAFLLWFVGSRFAKSYKNKHNVLPLR